MKEFEMMYVDNSRKILDIYRRKEKNKLDVLSKNCKIRTDEKETKNNIDKK